MEERAMRGARMAAEEITVWLFHRSANPGMWFGSVPFQVQAIDDALPDRQDYGKLIATVQRDVIKDLSNGFNGVLGDRYSAASKMLSYALASSGIFQCSVWSTSPGLGDKASFPTFFRLVADDNFQALVVLDLIRSQGWKKIGVLVGEESYGQGLLDKIRSSVDSYGISLLGSYTFYMDDPAGVEYRVNQLKDLGARIILLFPNGEADAVKVFRVLKANGMLTKGFETKFTQRWGVAPPSGAVAWYDATYAFAYAFKKLMNDYGYSATEISTNKWLEKGLKVNQFTNFSFTGAMGKASWQANGDSANALFHVRNLVGSEFVEVALGEAGALSLTSNIVFASGLTTSPSDSPTLTDQTIGYKKSAPAVIIAIASVMLVITAVSTVPLVLFQVPTTVSCNSYMALLTVGFGTVVGGILVKLRRLYRIFDNRIAHRRASSNTELLAQSGAILLIELLLVFIWSGAFPLLANEHNDLRYATHYYQCASSNHGAGEAMMLAVFIYNGLLVLACCYFAFATRNIYSAYNEAKAIGIAIYNILFCALIILLTRYLTPLAPVPSFLIRSSCVLIAVGVAYCALCGRFLYGLASDKTADRGTPGDDAFVKDGAANRRGFDSKPTALPSGVKSERLPVRGSTRITSKQWRNFTAHIMLKPGPLFVLVNEEESDRALAVPLNQVTVELKDDRFSIRWPRGEVEAQAESPQSAQDWVTAIRSFTRANSSPHAATPASILYLLVGKLVMCIN
ncbi:periplasmic binding protein-like I [Fimicolochytrium jonesii]|uniref:periplasmic binding protein-like I n=1 Tax=Fimicolochytrium jonesii TaxID=1396493 RepID=UPI0022FEE049|nr:periplasmic binding protein-like I [Fimicolochytrium jonesii]KAI8821033.1 periplasmic binding protein-like I [Fimicolochytrium jonesii]